MYSNPPMDYAYHTPSSHQWSIPPTYSTPTPTPSFPSFPWELFTPYYTHGSSSPKFYLNHGYSPHTPTSYPPPPNSYSSSHYPFSYNNHHQPLQPTKTSYTIRKAFEKHLQVFHPSFKKTSKKIPKKPSDSPFSLNIKRTPYPFPKPTDLEKAKLGLCHSYRRDCEIVTEQSTGIEEGFCDLNTHYSSHVIGDRDFAAPDDDDDESSFQSASPNPDDAFILAKEIEAYSFVLDDDAGSSSLIATQTVVPILTPSNIYLKLLVDKVDAAGEAEDKETLKVYSSMHNSSVHGNTFTHPLVLKSCATLLSIPHECSVIEPARKVFDEMSQRSVVSWIAVILTYCHKSLMNKALSLMKGMLVVGFEPSSCTFVSILSSSSSDLNYFEFLWQGMSIHCFVVKLGRVCYEVSMDNSMMGMYAQFGQMDEARKVFEFSDEKSIVSWTTIMGGYVKVGCTAEAYKLFNQMQYQNIDIDVVVFLNLISGCIQSRQLLLASSVHSLVLKCGCDEENSIENLFITMYANCVNLIPARRILYDLKSVLSWMSMIVGYTRSGHLEELDLILGKLIADTDVKRKTWVEPVDFVASDGENDDDDTMLDPAWPHFQLVYELLFCVAVLVGLLHRVCGSFSQKTLGQIRNRKSGTSDGTKSSEKGETITFAGVAGVDEAKEELEEIVEFLRNPDKYIRLGARPPRGVLLVGLPGTGKILLAKAVAGEADVPFISCSASEFVELYVGLGASRVRDLFAKAKKEAPSIIFIDEIDVVAKSRDGKFRIVSNDEREQTLNQLLTEMDGFDSNSTVIVLGATNRADVLDPALRRPGRFDRVVMVETPDRIGRESILKVHVSKKELPLANDVYIGDIASMTTGFTRADLANLVNEAAVLAGRKDKVVVEKIDFIEASTIAKPLRVFFNWSDYLKFYKLGTYSPYTPSIQLLYGLRAALDLIFLEGLEQWDPGVVLEP